MDFRERRGSQNFFDLHYHEFVRDPIAEVRRIYEHFGEALSADAEAAMTAHLAASPQGRYGSHEYSLEKTGLAPEQVNERFADYCAHFGVVPEE
jgi:hypothetical protein